MFKVLHISDIFRALSNNLDETFAKTINSFEQFLLFGTWQGSNFAPVC